MTLPFDYYVMGVDPGVHGACALLRYQDGSPVSYEGFRPNMTHKELVGIAVRMYENMAFVNGPDSLVFYEKVGTMPHDGRVGARTFGLVDGLVRGALLARGAVIREVLPMTWEAKMGCMTGGDKRISKARAQELFPQVKVTLTIADALLIASYGRLVVQEARTLP